jgi:3-oxoacyl-[acyl-carrier protein] reductase
MKLLEGKKVLVTGGSRGIGASIVRVLANQGAKVGFTYVSESSREMADSLAASIEADGKKIRAYKSNAADYSEAEQLMSTFISDFGSIDVLVNNAGITKDTLLMRMSETQWDDVLNVNLKSVFNLTKHSTRHFLKNQGGSIINMSSVVGVFGNAGQANYAASKAGIIGFTKSIAKELGSRNIRCNAIAPGFIGTEMTAELDDKTKENFLTNIPMKRLGTGDDVANTVLYLSSDLSAYVTGQVISVCGGLNI